MGGIELLRIGVDGLLSPFPIFLIIAGVISGAIFGAIPGLSGVVIMILMLPIVFQLTLVQGLILLAAAYCGGTFGGAFSSILLNIPGSPESVCTSFDGYPRRLKGLAGEALGASVTVSAIGGFFGAFVFIFAAPRISEIALILNSADYFALIVMGLMVIGAISGKSLVNGLISGALGVLFGTVGFASHAGVQRFSFGYGPLTAGFSFVAVMVGIFALSEIMARYAENVRRKEVVEVGAVGHSIFRARQLIPQWFNILRSSILGTIMGFVPGLGSTLASFVAYGTAKSMSRHPEKFGTGTLEGIIAPETGNNAATGGAMIPLLTLGIPGGAATAVMLAAFLYQGVSPGPMIFIHQSELVGNIMVAMLLANFFVFLVGRLGVVPMVKILHVNYTYIVACVGPLCFIGAFSLRNMMFDPTAAIIAGIIGYFWKKNDFPAAPFILGLVLGPMADQRFGSAMVQHSGNILGVLTSPIGFWFLIVGLGFILPSIFTTFRDLFKGDWLKNVTIIKTSFGTPIVFSMLIITFIYLWYLTTYWRTVESGVNASLWPRIALGSLILLSFIRILIWFVNFRIAKKHNCLEVSSLYKYFAPDGKYTFIVFGIFISYFYCQKYLGFIFLSLIYYWAILFLGGIKSYLKIIIISFIFLSLTLYVFVSVMYIFLPVGEGWVSEVHHMIYGWFL